MGERVKKARRGYAAKDFQEIKAAHTKSAIHEELHEKETGQYLKDVVYGASDGIITTFAVVSGVTGAALSSGVILVLGIANLLADGLSMAVGNYIGSKSEQEYYETEYEREKWETENIPEGEREELREIYAAKGLKGKELDNLVTALTKDQKIWVETMMTEELGMLKEEKSPVNAAIATFLAFVVAGLVPLISYILALRLPFFEVRSFETSVVMTGVAIFSVGALRSRFIPKSWVIAGAEMLAVAGGAAFVSYGVGALLAGLA